MNKRQSAIIRVISWSVVAVVLAGLLVLGINGRINWWSGSFPFSFGSSFSYMNANKYDAGPGQVDADNINALEINWLDGEVAVQTYEGDSVRFTETADKSLKKEEQLRYYNDRGTLKIQYKKAGRTFFSFGGRSLNKKLVVEIPESLAEKLRELSVDTVSGDVKISGVHAEDIELDSTSGDLILMQCSAVDCSADSTSGIFEADDFVVENELEVSTTSGDFKMKGSVAKLEFDTVSGDLNLDSERCPEKVVTDSVSGSVTLIIPENEGFTYDKDTVSGSLQCEFEVTQREDKGTYRDGDASFSFDTVSGDITIKKK